MGEPVPLPHHGRPGAVHGHRAELQHGRLLCRPLHQRHGLVLQRTHARTLANPPTYVNPSDRFVIFCPCLSFQPAERVLQKAAEWRHLQVQVRQLQTHILEPQDAELDACFSIFNSCVCLFFYIYIF